MSLRLESAKFFREADGSRSAQFFSGPVHFQTPGGVWEEIDPTLIPSERPGYAFRNRQGPFVVEFAAVPGIESLVRVQTSSGTIRFSPLGVSPLSQPEVHANAVTYPDVYPAIDLRYAVTNDGLRELLVLKEPPAEPLTFRFPLLLTGITAREEADGTISLLGSGNDPEFEIRGAWMEDNAGADGDGGVRTDQVAVNLVTEAGKTLVEISPDLAWLSDPARVYPVTIDPELNPPVRTNYDAYVHSGTPNTSYGAEDVIRVGRETDGSLRRGFLKFENLGALSGKRILDASLNVYPTWHVDCSTYWVQLQRTDSPWGAGVTWNSQPAASANLGSEPACAGQWMEYIVTETVANWVGGSWPNYGFRLTAPEHTANARKRFASLENANQAAVSYLWVEYNSSPGTPVGMTPADGTRQSELTPLLCGNYQDADGPWDGTLEFEIYNSSWGLHASGEGEGVDGNGHDCWDIPDQTPLQDGTYYWRVRGRDDYESPPVYSGWSGWVQYAADAGGPTGRLTSPRNGDTLSNEVVTLAATPNDASGVAKVEFYSRYLGRNLKIGEDTSGSDGWTASVDSTKLPEGRLDLFAVYTDTANPEPNVSCCSPGAGVSVVVDNYSPTPDTWGASVEAPGLSPTAATNAEVALGTGALVMTSKDVELPGRGFPATLERTYNSRGQGGMLGPGWRTNLEEVLIPMVDGSVIHVDRAGREHRYTPITEPGVQAEYWNGMQVTPPPALTRSDPQIDFDWGGGSPGPGVGVDSFSVRWTGFVDIPTDGDWTFSTTTDDGARLWVNDRLVVDDWQDHGPTTRTGTLWLAAGRTPIRMEYYESGAGSTAKLGWSGPGVSSQSIPPSRLSNGSGTPPAAGLEGEYWNGISLSGPLLTRSDGQVNFNWDYGSPGAGVGADYFAARWTGLLDVPAAGDWSFFATADDGVRVWVDEQVVINAWRAGPPTEFSGSIYLPAGRHELRMEYFENAATAVATLSWQGPGVSKQIIPGSSLSHPTGAFQSPPGTYESLTQATDGSYTLVDTSEVRSRFSPLEFPTSDAEAFEDAPDGKPGARLEQVKDRHGNMLKIVTDAETGLPQYVCVSVSACDASTAKVTLTSTTDESNTPAIDRLDLVEDAAGRMWTFEYHPTTGSTPERLSAVEGPAVAGDPHVPSVAYDYQSGRLNSVTYSVDDLVDATAEVSYDIAGRVSSLKDPEAVDEGVSGPAMTITYDQPVSGKVTVTSAEANTAHAPSWPGEVYGLGTSGELLTYADPLGEATTYDYFRPELNLKTETDPAGTVTSWTYDTSGNLTSETIRGDDGSGGTMEIRTEYAYQGNKLVSETIDNISDPTEPEHVTTYAYDSSENLSSVIDGEGNETTYGYWPTGETRWRVDPRGNVPGASPDLFKTEFVYTSDGNLQSVTSPPRSEQDPQREVTRYAYDPFGFQDSVTRGYGSPEETVADYAYDKSGNLISVTEAAGTPDSRTTTFEYDRLGRRIRVVDPVANASPSDDKLPADYDWISQYDLSGRVNRTEDPLGRVQTFAYDWNGNMVTEVDPRGNEPGANPASFTTRYEYGPGDRLRFRIEPGTEGPTTEYRYDELGRLEELIGPKGDKQFNYDAADRTTSEVVELPNPQDPQGPPVLSTTSYTFDAADNVLTETSPLGNVDGSSEGSHTTTYAYDLANRLRTVAEPGQSPTTYEYDPAGNVTTLTDPTGFEKTFAFDSQGREESRTVLGSDHRFASGAVDPSNPQDLAAFSIDTGGTIHAALSWDPSQSSSSEHTQGSLSEGQTSSRTLNIDGESVIDASFYKTPGTRTQQTSLPGYVSYQDIRTRTVDVTSIGKPIMSTLDWESTQRYFSLEQTVGLLEKRSHSVSVTAAGRIEATLYWDLVADLDLRLYGPSGNLVAENTSLTENPTTISFDVPASAIGSYRFEVASKHLGATYALVGSYPSHANLDLELVGPGGQVVASAATSGRPESLTYSPPTTGTYTFRVTSDIPASFTLSIQYPVVAHAFVGLRLVDPNGGLVSEERSSEPEFVSVFHTSVGGTYRLEIVNLSADIDVPNYTVDLHSRLTQNANLDLYLLNPAGQVVAEGEDHSLRPETLTYSGTAGNYTIKVITRDHPAEWRLDFNVPTEEVESRTYDAAGRLSEVTTASGTTVYTYTVRGALDTVDLPGPESLTYDYDPGGRLARVTDSLGTHTYTYDRAGMLAAATEPGPAGEVTTSYGYDAAGREASVNHAGSTFAFEYDSSGRLVSREEPGRQTLISYADRTFPTAVQHFSGERDVRTFNPLGQITSIEFRSQSGSLTSAFEYAYDVGETLRTVTDVTNSQAPIETASYEYDGLGRVTEETVRAVGDLRTLSYAYDAQDNRTRVVSGQETTTFAYSPAGQLLSRTLPSGATTAYVYDSNGNLSRSVSVEATTEFAWDPTGHLLSVSEPGRETVSFSYDASGKRVRKQVGAVTYSFAYEKGRLASISNGDQTSVFTYTDGGTPLTLSIGGQTYVYRTDYRGSVIELTNAATHVPAATYVYDAWGNVVESIGVPNLLSANPFTFLAAHGVEWEQETGLYLMGARFYDPELGRFISPDPARADESQSTYAYADNNPVTKGDPTGLYTALLSGRIKDGKYNRGVDVDVPKFQGNLGKALAAKGGPPERTRPWRWSRRLEDVAETTDRFVIFMKYKCPSLHRRRPPQTCNAIGHSAGGLIAAPLMFTNVGMDFLMTMGAVGISGLPKFPKPASTYWINLVEGGVLGMVEWIIEPDIEEQISIKHGAFWSDPESSQWAARGICIVRGRYVSTSKEQTCV